MRPSGIWLSMIASLALAARGPARAECPVNTITARYFSGATTHSTSAPRDTASKVDYGSHCTDYCYSWYVYVDATYDLVAGTMSAQATGTYAGIGEASASTHDVFTLLGPTAAPAITFHARATAGAAVACVYPGGQADASIREGTSNSASVIGTRDACRRPSSNLDVSITRAAGSTFDLYLTVHAVGGTGLFGNDGDGYASLSLSFPDLPLGYSVVSCQGFAAGQIVPTRQVSWGEIKTRYR